MKFKSILTGAVCMVAATSAPLLAESTQLLRQPALSQDHLAFVYAGDIWVANRDGSEPRRLTSSPGDEREAVFSPDGRWLAYRANHENNQDVYIIPVEGGQPTRLTWHPGFDSPVGWSADGSEVAFVSYRETDHGRSGKLYHVSTEGGLPVKQMDARIYRGAYGADGQLAYIPHGSGYNGLFGGSAGWKGYRGGTVPEVYVMDEERESVTIIPGEDSTNFSPVWLGSVLYFLSDREDKNFNVFRYDPADASLSKVSSEDTWDIRALGGHGDTLVYEAGGQLKQLDPATGQTSVIEIDIRPDLPQLRAQWKNAAGNITASDISRTGKRALVTARGEVFTVPLDEGATRNISNSEGQREYTALWSPDGQQIAWITEQDGGQAMVVSNQDGSEQKSYPLGPHFYFLSSWTGGDNPHLVYTDNHLGLFAMDAKNGRITKLATASRRDQVGVASSPDGRWLAYTQEQPNYFRDLMLHDFESGKTTRISDGMADVAAPAFSQDGQYLFFAASTNSGPLQMGLNMTSQERPYRAAIYAAVLTADGTSPLLEGAGDEEAPAKEEDEDKDSDSESGEKDEGVKVVLQGLPGRIIALPLPERNYGNLQVGADGDLFYVAYEQPGVTVLPPGTPGGQDNRLMRFDFEEKEEKMLMPGVNGFTISAGGEHMIIAKADGSLATAEIGDDLEPEGLNLDGVRVFVDPRTEWTQIFDEGWRMQQEYFYADNMHGLDWDSVYEKYRPLVDHVGRREDLNTVMVEMIAELHAGHNRVGGGDVHRENGVSGGLLGANIVADNGRHRIEKIYTGESWNPFIASPLAEPGNEAREGEFILAVNGRELTDKDNIFAALQGLVGKRVTLRVGPEADGDDARDIVVTPVDDEWELRLWSWIEANRQRVDEATDGRVGYIYLPNTAGAGYTYFNRMFFSQLDKEALIVDERSNAGGQAANYIIELLNREHLSGWADRDGLIWATPAGAVHGPKLMLIDQDAGSGGDYLPFTFRSTGVGKLMGTRTWGGLIGIYTNPPLMDGGTMTVPFFRFFDTEGNWSVENEGVAPDIEVRLDPLATNRGVDSQLEAGITEILGQLESYQDDILREAPPLPTELGE